MLLLFYKFKKLKKIEKNECFCIFLRSCRHIPTFSADVADMISTPPSPTLSPTRHLQHCLELWDIVQAPVVIPPAPAPSPLLDADFRKKNTKVKRTICDAVRDHIIPHLTGKDYAFEIWASLCKLYQRPN